MGGGSWKASDWDSFKTTATRTSTGAAKSRDEIFSSSMIADFNPKNIALRESCDSADSPNSTAIMIGLDVTGSMGMIPEALIKDGLGNMTKEILDRKPVTNPHIMMLAVGDDRRDSAPLQATQFEADIRIAEQLKSLWLEGRGGGNGTEGYQLAWYFAALKTKIDCFDKRGEKGILFTMGDEGVPAELYAHDIERIFGDKVERDIPTAELLRMAEERYDVYHLVIKEGDYCQRAESKVMAAWKPLLGERLIPVSDYTKVPEIIVSTLEVIGGKPKADVTASWSGSTALVVRDAIAALPQGTRGSLAKRDAGGPPSIWRPGTLRPGGR